MSDLDLTRGQMRLMRSTGARADGLQFESYISCNNYFVGRTLDPCFNASLRINWHKNKIFFV